MKVNLLFPKQACALLLLPGLFMACQSQPQTTQNPPTITELICRTEPADTAWYSAGQKAPLFDSLGTLHFPVTTRNPEAQRYIDQGLLLAVGFNHAEAARSFFEATRLDSTCAMAYWGFSYVLGPNYNAGMEPDNYQRAYTAIQRAQRLSAPCTPKEKALIQALAARYPAQAVEDRRPYDVAYATALKEVYQQFADDPLVAAFYAESLMDLHPWDLWEKDGRPKPWTPEIITVLEKSIQQAPEHLALHHLYIHAVEASTSPERGLNSARVLGKLAPKSSHLLHMPAHIYIRTGHYHEGSLANWAAVAVDSAYLSGLYAQGSFPLAYFPHNYHFLAATATLEGNYQWAMQSAQKVTQTTKKKLMTEPGWSTLQHYYTIPYHIAVKFGRWDEVMTLSRTDTVQLPYPTAIRHYARGRALVGQQQLPEARRELQQLEVLTADPAIDELTIWGINSMRSILEIARRVLKAEILVQEGQLGTSIKLLREAVALEDGLNYNEPPDWFFSVRHTLGEVLLTAKQYEEAEKVFTQDLEELPRNGWALQGLLKAQLGQQKKQQAAQTQAFLVQAWKWADRELKTDSFAIKDGPVERSF